MPEDDKTNFRQPLLFNITMKSSCSIANKLTISIVILLCLKTVTWAQTPGERAVTEYEIKAAFLYNFLLFTNWPEPGKSAKNLSDKTIAIGIVGEDPFGRNFSDVEGKLIKSGKKKLVIKRFGPYSAGTDLKKCQLLFISASEQKNLNKIIAGLRGAAVLTVADFEGFLRAGGMIKLLNVKEMLRWEINRAPIEAAGLKVSSQVFSSAIKVVEIK